MYGNLWAQIKTGQPMHPIMFIIEHCSILNKTALKESKFMSNQKSYCIQWTTFRGQTHSGPTLMTQSDYLGSLDVEGLLDSSRPMPTPPEPRRKTLEESQALADKMNNSPEFNNQSHKAVLVKRKTRDQTADSEARV